MPLLHEPAGLALCSAADGHTVDFDRWNADADWDGLMIPINLAFFLAEVAANSQLAHTPFFEAFSNVNSGVVILFGGKAAPYIYRGEWWRLITAGFLHAGFLHIAMNSYTLFILVTEVEQFYGTSRLIVAYVFSTFTGFLFSLLFSPRSLSLGASAAAFGLIGIMLAMSIRRRLRRASQRR